MLLRGHIGKWVLAAFAFLKLLVASPTHLWSWWSKPLQHLLNQLLFMVVGECLREINGKSVCCFLFRLHYLLQRLILVISQHERHVIVQVKLCKGSKCVFLDDVLLFLAVTNVIRCVRVEVYKSVRDEANKIHRFFLGSHVWRQSFLNYFIKCG